MDEQDFSQLTRRADPEQPDCWFIYWQDIHAGTIVESTTVNARTEWRWSAGFYPGSHAGEVKGGTADTFEAAREKFLPAWLAFAHSRKPGDFEEYRDHR